MSRLEPVQSAAATSADLARSKQAVDFGAALEGQTTLEIASRRIGELRDPLALRPWLMAIQVREAFRFRRRIARFVRLSPTVEELQSSPGPDSDVIALRAALPKLPPRARAAVVLHYLGGLSVAEVARAMNISENTTKGHLKAGLARLREEFRDD